MEKKFEIQQPVNGRGYAKEDVIRAIIQMARHFIGILHGVVARAVASAPMDRCHLLDDFSVSKDMFMSNKVWVWWPALVCILIYYALIAGAVSLSVQATDGQLVYPLDDTYIHMAMAKNFSEHGVWGFTRYAFSSSTTSPLYTGLLAAGFILIGQNDVLPLALNILFGSILIAYIHWLLRNVLPLTMIFPLLLVICLVTSVPALTLLGMEHLLHTLLTLVFVVCGAKNLASGTSTVSQKGNLLLIAALLPMIRYEGIFLVVVVSGLILLKRRFQFAIVLIAVGALPILLYGVIANMHGWFFLPNSVLLKGNMPDFSSVKTVFDAFGYHAIIVMVRHGVILLLVILSLLTCLYTDGGESKWWESVIFISIIFLHLQAAAVGWLYRYEAYLVAVGLVVTLPFLLQLLLPILPSLISIRPYFMPMAVTVMGLVVLIVPFAERAKDAWTTTQEAMHDRFLEHIQPAKFLKKYYPGATVVVNDIGAVGYFTDCHLLDMYGLGSIEPVQYRRGKGGYTKKEVDEWTVLEKVEIAILQIEWKEVSARIPDTWIKVAEWKIPRNVVFGDYLIGWFAANKESAIILSSHLKEFKAQVPNSIEMMIFF